MNRAGERVAPEDDTHTKVPGAPWWRAHRASNSGPEWRTLAGGNAAPCVGDFDGDGVRDLMVGEAYQGRMRVFHNVGSNEQFRASGYTWFKCGADLGRIPSG